jgi:uncharacterized membrane protein YhaH (DUF805 family)
MTYLMLNMFICLDLVLIIRNPFGSKDKRIKFYYLASYSMGIISALLFGSTDAIGSFFQVIVMFTYLGAAVASIFFCFRRLRSTGLSNEIKTLIYRRHIYWIVSFVLANAFLIYLNVMVLVVGLNQDNSFNNFINPDSIPTRIFRFLTNG